MENGVDPVDLDNITNAEFRDQIKHWIEEQGIHANLQLQMKKDLIDQISRTAMGRKINLKLQTHQGIVLSPLVLVLNTLVAEFLYTQNCHYTLSVFSNEVPFKNTLPDFTKSKHFRLDRVELREIFEALGMEHYSGLVEKYETGAKEGAKSLLYIIFKSMLASVRACEEKVKRLRNEEVQRDTTKSMLDGLEVEKLHRNVERLLQRVKVVGKSIERVEELQRSEDRVGDTRQDETTSLRACTENVSKFVERLETCSRTFETLVEKLRAQAEAVPEDTKVQQEEVKPQETTTKSYTDFLNELKTTTHGKKYVAKLQKQILKLMEKEKTLIEAKYEKRLHEVELEYKTKVENLLAERIKEMSVPREIRERSPKLTITRTSDSEESTHFMKKIDEKLNRLYQHERNVDEKLVTLKNDLQKQELRQSRYFQSLKAAETKEKKLLVLQDVEKQLLATFEDETQMIIRNAKETMEHLEGESEKINRSFQQYLHKQREDKRKLNDEKIQIWQKYNDEKLELNQRELIGLNGRVAQEVPIAKNIRVTSVESFPEPVEFENPFRSFDPHKYLRRPKVCNVVLETPKHFDVVDVAVNTSIEPTVEKSNEVDTKENSTTQEVPKQPEGTAPSEEPKPSNQNNSNEIAKVQAESKLSDLLAKDTLNLKRSIEENLQKLDQMSKTYTKSSSSSDADKQRTYNVKPSAEKMTDQRSLDDLSSVAELGLSDGEMSVVSVEKKQEDRYDPDLDSTKELLEFARVNFPVEGVLSKGVEGGQKKESLDMGSLGSFSDLDLSGTSGSNQDQSEKKDSVGDILEQISTGKRSLSDDSWN